MVNKSVARFKAAARCTLVALAVSVSSIAGAEPTPIPAKLPGAEVFPSPLRSELSKVLAELGPDYVPRTQHRRDAGGPVYTNRLLLESSPYLRQHAHNPVNWHAWGDEAFATAKRLDRPLLVSVGYSTCHWCHVMEEETFDDPKLAEYLNTHFIAIKVDREERPDVDAIYMAAIHAMGARGGWPLNVFVTPDREPFYGGTYFPPNDRPGPTAASGRPSFRRVLESLHIMWTDEREKLADNAKGITRAIRSRLTTAPGLMSSLPTADLLERATRDILQNADHTEGGRKGRIKFPSSVPLRFLLRFDRRHKTPEARALAVRTLEKMARGGINDALGGGFHRYSTDARWLVPHFEKMLYDNALLASVYLEAWQATGREEFADVVRTTLDFIDRDLGMPEGGFASALDADSKSPEGELVEGWFFTWTPSELQAAVGKTRARQAAEIYGVTQSGDMEGRSVLRRWKPAEEIKTLRSRSKQEFESKLTKLRDDLFAARSRRAAPLRDEKVLVGWNGLAISAFTQAGFALNEPRYLDRAERAARFLLEEMRPHGRLVRVFAAGKGSGPSFLEDYAFFIAALLDLYEGTGNASYLREAIVVQQELDSYFSDESGGGYFATANDQKVLIAREKPQEDGVVPSGNSVCAMNLLRLHDLTGKAEYGRRLELLFGAFGPLLHQAPAAFGDLLLAAERRLDEVKEIVLVAPPTGHDAAFAALKQPLRRRHIPSRISVIAREGSALEESAALVPLVGQKRALRGLPTAFVCRNHICDNPTSDPVVFTNQLGEIAPLRGPGSN